MEESIKAMNEIYPITKAEAVYVDNETTLDVFLKSLNFKSIVITDFGAKGDGIIDDSPAIQKALDSLKETGGNIYFPKGIYKLNKCIKYYSNQKLIFDEATLLRGSEDMNLLITNYADNLTGNYDMTKDVEIIGAIFDANANYNTNCTLLGFIHSDNTMISKCKFENLAGGWHCLEVNASKDTIIDSCYFKNTKTVHNNAEMIQLDAALNNTVYPWEGKKDGTVCKFTMIKNCVFENSDVSPAIGNHSFAKHEFTTIRNNIFRNLTNGRGVITFVDDMENIDIYDNTFENCEVAINTNAKSVFARENRFKNVKEISKFEIEKVNNIVEK